MALSAKQTALKIIEQLPDDATLDDVVYAIDVRKKIERGLRDIDERATVSHEDAMREAGEGAQRSSPVQRRLVRRGHVTVLEPTQSVPPITVEMVNALVDQMRRERDEWVLGHSDLRD